jgi:transposase-like protein
MSVLLAPPFHNEAAAVARLEQIVWPNGPVCPHCGGLDRITPVKGGRIGLKRCGQCKGQFRATVGTVFEDSKVPLHKWFQAAHLLASSKKGISSHQLHRTLGVTYKTAWFMAHRLREAMRAGEPGDMTFMGGEGKVVEVDETYFGKNPEEDQPKMTTTGKPFKDNRYSKSKREKRTVVALVERGGEARSVHVPTADKETVTKIVLNNIYRETELNTDESGIYTAVGRKFAAHETVNHSAKEYARGDVTTNTVEGFFSIFKRGMKGIYQHCSEKHLHRYLAEFDFRYNNRVRLGVDDEARTARALQGIVGKRLTYRLAGKQAIA